MQTNEELRWRGSSVALSIKTPNDGGPSCKEFYGGNDEGTYSDHFLVAGDCDLENALVSSRERVTALSRPFHFQKKGINELKAGKLFSYPGILNLTWHL